MCERDLTSLDFPITITSPCLDRELVGEWVMMCGQNSFDVRLMSLRVSLKGCSRVTRGGIFSMTKERLCL